MSDKPEIFPGGETRDKWIAYWDGDNWKRDDLPIDVIVNEDIRAAMKEITRQDTEIVRLTAENEELKRHDRVAELIGGLRAWCVSQVHVPCGCSHCQWLRDQADRGMR